MAFMTQHDSCDSFVLTLVVEDPEVIAELEKREEGHARSQLALTALRIGILALRQAQGRVDPRRMGLILKRSFAPLFSGRRKRQGTSLTPQERGLEQFRSARLGMP